MSLLNDVLKEIDDRRNELHDHQILTSVLVSEDIETTRWLYPVAVIAVVFVCSSLTFWAVNHNRSDLSLTSSFEIPQTSIPLDWMSLDRPTTKVEAIATTRRIRFPAPIMELPRPGIVVENGLSPNIAKTQTALRMLEAPTSEGLPHELATQAELANQPDSRMTVTRQSGIAVDTLQWQGLIAAFVDKKLSAQQFQAALMPRLDGISPMKLEMAMNQISYTNLRVDELVVMLDINRALASQVRLDRTDATQTLYGQLRLKSSEPGYWAFQQAVLFDKKDEFTKAVYFYRKALQTEHINVKQRRLSQMRVEQLQYQAR